MNIATFILLGVATGICAGFFGVGGGIILVPILIWKFHYSQHDAQGMSLVALLLPVGILGAITYYRANPFPIKTALWIACGMFLGTLIGAMYAQKLSDRSLKMAFGIFMMLAGLKLVLGK